MTYVTGFWKGCQLHTRINIYKYVIQLFSKKYLKNVWSCLHTILHRYTVIQGTSAYQLFNEKLAELPAIIDSFLSILKSVYMGWLVGWLGWWVKNM